MKFVKNFSNLEQESVTIGLELQSPAFRGINTISGQISGGESVSQGRGQNGSTVVTIPDFCYIKDSPVQLLTKRRQKCGVCIIFLFLN